MPVLLPTGERIRDEASATGYLMSPVEDLSGVAQAGRQTREGFEYLLSNLQIGAGAIVHFYSRLEAALDHGGAFYYQREGNRM